MVSAVEIEYHPYVTAHLDPVMEVHKKYNIVAQSYGPLSPILRHPTGGPLKPILTRIAQRLSKETGKDVDEASVLLLWTMQQGVVALTSSSQESRIQKLAETEELPDLSKAEMDEIDSVGRQVHHRAYVSYAFRGFTVMILTMGSDGTYEQGLPGSESPAGCESMMNRSRYRRRWVAPVYSI